MADRYLLESSLVDGYQLEDGSGVLSLDNTTFEIVNHANTAVKYTGSGVYEVTKSGGSSGVFDADAVSSLASTGDFALRIEPLSIGGNGEFFGLNADPLTDSTYTGIDFAIIFTPATPGGFSIYESGVQISTNNPYTTYGWIWRTGTTIGYGGGPDLATAQASPARTTTSSATLYFDSSISGLAADYNVYFYVPAAPTIVALTGQAVSSAIGSVTAAPGNALTGQSVTASRGTLTPTGATALTGQSITAARGSVAAVATFSASGQSLAAAQGSLTGSSAAAITGQSLTAARGSVTADRSIALTGQGVSAVIGTATASPTTALTGQAATVSSGTVAVGTGDVTLALAGQSVSASQGAFGPSTAPALLGVSAFIAQSSVSPQYIASLTGLGLSAGQGPLAVAPRPPWLPDPVSDAVGIAAAGTPAAIVVTQAAAASSLSIAASSSPAAATFTRDTDPSQLEWDA